MTKILVIGCGRWGRKIVSALVQEKHEVVGIVDPLIDPSKISFYGAEIPLFDELSDAIVETNPSHVIVAIPPGEARDRALREIARHDCVKHVRIEKPVGDIPVELYDGRVVSVGLQMMHDDKYQLVNEMIGETPVESVYCVRVGQQRHDITAEEDFGPHCDGFAELFLPDQLFAHCYYSDSQQIRFTKIRTYTGQVFIVDEISGEITIDGHVCHSENGINNPLKKCLQLFIDGKPGFKAHA